MRKVVIPLAGGYEQLTIETRPEPTPALEEIVVTTEAIFGGYSTHVAVPRHQCIYSWNRVRMPCPGL